MDNECKNCGSTDFFLDVGFYYCKECGTKSDALEYINVVKDSKHYTSAGRVEKERVQKEVYHEIQRKYFSRSNHRLFVYNEALDKIGARLSSATQIIYSICIVLVERCGVNKDFIDVCMGIFQKYLSTYKVAFCEEELNDGSEEKFSVQIKLKPYELKKLLKEKRKEAEELAQKEINDKLLNLGLFDPCDNSVKNKTVKKSTDVILKPEDYYRVRETLVSKKALDRAGHINLEMNILFSIIYVSLVYSGIHFIQMSDLMRWYREGRFYVTQDHLNDTQTVNYRKIFSSYRIESNNYRLEMIQKTKTSPLCKSNYSNIFLWQFLSLPRLVVPLDAFDELVNRYIYELNLPNAFVSRIQKYRKMFNPLKNQNCDLWKEYFPLINNCSDILEEKFSDENTGLDLANFFKIAIPKTHALTSHRNVSFIDFSIEVKAMALILFALKREFSFNNKDEYEKPNNEDDFYFVDWLKQLNLRSQLADGKSINYVTSERNLYNFKYENKIILANNGKHIFYEFNDHLDSNFDHQIPSKNRVFMNQKCFSDCLEDIIDIPKKSDNEDVLFAPLKFYGEECIDDNSLKNNDTFLLIKKNFSNNKLKNFKDIKEKGHYLFPSVESIPCVKLEEKINDEANRCKIYFNTQNLLAVYENIRDSLPTLFNQLLYMMSKIIGEWPHILYLAFLAVENAIVFNNECNKSEDYFKKGGRIFAGQTKDSKICYFFSLNKPGENIFDLKLEQYTKEFVQDNIQFNVFKNYFASTIVPYYVLIPGQYAILNKVQITHVLTSD